MSLFAVRTTPHLFSPHLTARRHSTEHTLSKDFVSLSRRRPACVSPADACLVARRVRRRRRPPAARLPLPRHGASAPPRERPNALAPGNNNSRARALLLFYSSSVCARRRNPPSTLSPASDKSPGLILRSRARAALFFGDGAMLKVRADDSRAGPIQAPRAEARARELVTFLSHRLSLSSPPHPHPSLRLRPLSPTAPRPQNKHADGDHASRGGHGGPRGPVGGGGCGGGRAVGGRRWRRSRRGRRRLDGAAT